MKSMIMGLLILTSASAFADRGFKCYGKQFEKSGHVIGQGEILVNVKDDGDATISRREGIGAPLQSFDLNFEALNKETGINVYMTPNVAGMGLWIHKANLNSRLGQYINLVLVPFTPAGWGERVQYNCLVYKSDI